MDAVHLTVDDQAVSVPSGTTILQAARQAGVYIPALCAHPDLEPFSHVELAGSVSRGDEAVRGDDLTLPKGCGLCAVSIDGGEDLYLSCETPVRPGMRVVTSSAGIQENRRLRLGAILAEHPHACLTCAEREGCSREPCSLNVPVDERCCPKLGRCELEKVAVYVGVPESLSRYRFPNKPRVGDGPLFEIDFNLCISCARCVRICGQVRGIRALAATVRQGKLLVGLAQGRALSEAECRFCGACVEVCPTGTVRDKGFAGKPRREDLIPCAANCPAGLDVPRYVRLLAEGKAEESLRVIQDQLPLPGVLGRVCFRPCEEHCRRGQVNEPIAICSLKRFAADSVQEVSSDFTARSLATGKKVAIIGSGPAGLSAAYFLSRLGHAVTVFESQSRIGGLLRLAIPQFRLPQAIIDREVERLRGCGIEFRSGTKLGRDTTVADLRKDGYKAILLATGSPLAKQIVVPGMDGPDVYWGLDFLMGVNSGEEYQVGPSVVVVGGGNVAVDAALTALRLGGCDVKLVCLESRGEMPAHPWEIEEALTEGVTIYCSWGPKEILRSDGKVSGLELARCTSVFDQAGAFRPSFDETATTTLEADTIILAIGQAADLSVLDPELRVERGPGGTLAVDPDTLATAEPGLFAAGELASGPSSVVEAVAMGKKAAVSIDRYLGGTGALPGMNLPPDSRSGFLGRNEGFAARTRRAMCRLEAPAAREFAEVELGFPSEGAQEEADRCLRCDLRLGISEPPLPPEKWFELGPQLREKAPEQEGVLICADARKHVILIQGVQNLRQALALRLENPKRARYLFWEAEPMYTRRESELLQQYMQQHGKMPEENDEADELF